MINAWRDVGRELVRLCQVQHAAASPPRYCPLNIPPRLCQVQHAAASATKERVKSLLPRQPVPTWLGFGLGLGLP